MADFVRASDVFRKQLRVTRVERGLTVRELARRMTDASCRMTASTISDIETGKRKSVSLDEALAFAQVLWVSLAHLLSPDDGQVLAPVPTIGYDGDTVRSWLAMGVGFHVMPGRLQTGEDLTDDERAQAELFYEHDIATHAQALFVALLAGAPKNERDEATGALWDRVERRYNALYADPEAMRNRARAEADARAAWPTVLRWLRTGTTAEPTPPMEDG